MRKTKDKFELDIKKSLEDYSAELPDNVWDSIASDVSRRNRIRLVWSASAIAAVVILFLGIRLSLDTTVDVSNSIQQPIVKIVPQINEEISVKTITANNIQTILIEQPVEITESAQELVQESAQNIPQKTKQQNAEPQNQDSQEDVEEISELTLLGWDKPENKQEKSKYIPKVSLDMTGIGVISAKVPSFASNEMAIYSEPTLSTSNQYQSSTTSDKMMPLPLTKFKAYHTTYKQPVSFGLSAGILLPKNFSLQTGMFATMLTTEFRYDHSSNNIANTATSWYIGIPLRAAWSFYKSRYFDAYVNMGGAIEKCVSFKNVGEDIIFSGIANTALSDITTKNIPLQFSVNASVGMQFNIIELLSIFFEPGVAYYFDNQPYIPTVRSENPWNFSMNAGLRFNL